RRRHTRFSRDWSSDVCSSDLASRLLARNATLAPGQTVAPRFAIHLPAGTPLGFYTGTVTALEGGTMPLAEVTFSFRVVPPEEAEIGRASCRDRVRDRVLAECA